MAILIIVDEPEGRGFGGVVAAPIFKEIATWSLRYLGIPSEEVRPIKVSSVSKAKKKKLPVPPKTVATDAQTGSPSLVAVGGGVPDLLGESMAVVLRKAKRAGLQVNLEGSGRSFKQSLPPGTPLPEDKQIIVYFRSPADRAAAAQGGGYAP